MPVMSKVADMLEKFGIEYEMKIISAHREPDVFSNMQKPQRRKASRLSLQAQVWQLICRVCALHCFRWPVIGTRCTRRLWEGMGFPVIHRSDALPVSRWATVAINGGANAGILAAKILAVSDPELLAKLKAYSAEMKDGVLKKDAKLQECGYHNYTK